MEKRDDNHDFSTVMVTLSGQIRKRMLSMAGEIDDADLHELGRESEPHVTVLFGLTGDSPEDVEKLVSGFGSFRIRFGKTSIFEGDEFDVVKVDVFSDELHELNKLIADNLEHENSHPKYIPHATLAYVNEGAGSEYEGMDGLDGREFEVKSVTFSGKDKGDRTEIPLGEEPMEKAIDFSINVLKAVEEDGEMFIEGTVLVPEVTDRQGDIVSEEEIRKAAYLYMEGAQSAGVMHKKIVSSEDAVLVESFIIHKNMKRNGVELKKGSWFVKFWVKSDILKKMVSDGKLNSFSIG